MDNYITAIALEGIELKAPVGYYDFEREKKNTFIIDIEVKVQTIPDKDHDDIHQTVNYEKLYKVVEEEMKVPCSLMEDSAHRILAHISELHKNILAINISLRKKNPPMNANIQYSRVSLHWDKTNAV